MSTKEFTPETLALGELGILHIASQIQPGSEAPGAWGYLMMREAYPGQLANPTAQLYRKCKRFVGLGYLEVIEAGTEGYAKGKGPPRTNFRTTPEGIEVVNQSLGYLQRLGIVEPPERR